MANSNSTVTTSPPVLYLLPINKSGVNGGGLSKSKSVNDVASLLYNPATGKAVVINSVSLNDISSNSSALSAVSMPSAHSSAEPPPLSLPTPHSKENISASKMNYTPHSLGSSPIQGDTASPKLRNRRVTRNNSSPCIKKTTHSFMAIDKSPLSKVRKLENTADVSLADPIISPKVEETSTLKSFLPSRPLMDCTNFDENPLMSLNFDDIAETVTIDVDPKECISETFSTKVVSENVISDFDIDITPGNISCSGKVAQKNLSTKISTLVFFDLETTGLPFQIGKPNVQITELSMIAMQRKEFEESASDELKDIRIIQKLCLCIRPRAMVSSGAAKITGLNNFNLSDQSLFDEHAAGSIISFLSHLPKPVCLVAHNGALFDFPLLKAEFGRLSAQLPDDILVADTLKAFRELGVPVFPPEKKICKSVKYTKSGQVSYSLENLHLYLFNKKPTGSHSSEGDCIALAKVCHRMKSIMLSWIDENSSLFSAVGKMW